MFTESVIDDLVTVDPWHPRYIRMYGTAAFVEREGQFGPGVCMRIAPRASWSWSVEKPGLRQGQVGFQQDRPRHSGVLRSAR